MEKSVDGGKQTLVENGATIETGRTYDLRVQVRGRQASATATATVDVAVDGGP